MDAGTVTAALEEARFDARQASRYEDLADDLRGPAELAEWERIAALLAAAPAGTVYDPDVDDVVQAELAADAAAADAVRAYAARTRENADQFAAVLEDIAANGLPSVEDCTPWLEGVGRGLDAVATRAGARAAATARRSPRAATAPAPSSCPARPRSTDVPRMRCSASAQSAGVTSGVKRSRTRGRDRS
ncbi:hypothetical protein [Streptomyces sp. NPDC058674]